MQSKGIPIERSHFTVPSKLGLRPSPRAGMVAFAQKYFDPIVIALSSVPLFLAANRFHPNSAALVALGFLLFGFAGYLLQREQSEHGSRWASLGLNVWSMTGLIAALVTYAWFARSDAIEIPALLWPFLIYAMYFALRVLPFRNTELLLLLVLLLSSYAFIIPLLMRGQITVLIALLDMFFHGKLDVLMSSLTQRPEIALDIAGAVWLSVVLASIAVHVRTWDYYETRFQSFRELVRWAGNTDASLNEIQTKLDNLGRTLTLEPLTVLRITNPLIETKVLNPADFGESLPAGADLEGYRAPRHAEIIAKYIPGTTDHPQIGPWPLTRGLLKESLETRNFIDCPDTRLPEWAGLFYNPQQAAPLYGDTRAEMVQPIFDSPSGQVIGFVDLQAKNPHALNWNHKDFLAAISAAIAPLLAKERLANLLERIEELRANLVRADSERDVFEHLAKFAREYLDVDIVTCYRLGFGNAWPQVPVWHLGAWFPSRLEDKFTRENPAPIALVTEWRPIFLPDSKLDARFFPIGADRAPEDYFIPRERVRSTVFLPIGTRQRRVSALFLNYRQPQIFSPATRLAIEIFRQTITPHIEEMRELEETREGFGQISLALHDLVRDSNATNRAVNSAMNRLEGAIKLKDWEQTKEHFDQVMLPLQTHHDYVTNASLKFNLTAAKLLRRGLKLAFDSANGVLSQTYRGQGLIAQVAADVERLPYDLRWAIFSLATEAAHNAFRSGGAQAVTARVLLEDSQVLLEVKSDGMEWDPQMPSKPYSEFGIEARLKLAHERMGASFSWNEGGKCLNVAIPALPKLYGVEPYD